MHQCLLLLFSLGITAVAPLLLSVTGDGRVGKYIRDVLLLASVTSSNKQQILSQWMQVFTILCP